MTSQPDFDTPADPDYLPFADGPYRMTMGLMALKPADWIEIGSRYAEEIALRKSLLESRRDEVLAAPPGSEAWRRRRGRRRRAARCWTNWPDFSPSASPIDSSGTGPGW